MSPATLRAIRALLLASVRVTRYDARRREEAPRYLAMARAVHRRVLALKQSPQAGGAL